MNSELTSLRADIDLLDKMLWEIIGKRINIAREIGSWKRNHRVAVLQEQRFEEVMRHCQQMAAEQGLSETVVEEVMKALHKESIRVES